MQLTKQTTETFIRKLASAPRSELDEIKVELGSIGSDDGQADDVRLVARRVASVVRALLSERG